jgi:hypothetical protein
MDDVRAVLDASAASARCCAACPRAGRCAACSPRPIRRSTRALVMIGSYARRLRSDDYPWGPTPAERERSSTRSAASGAVRSASRNARRAAADPRFRELVGRLPAPRREPGRGGRADPHEQRDRHPPRAADRARADAGRASHGDRCLRSRRAATWPSIPGATFVELPGDDHLPFVGDQDAMLDGDRTLPRRAARYAAGRQRAGDRAGRGRRRSMATSCWRRSTARRARSAPPRRSPAPRTGRCASACTPANANGAASRGPAPRSNWRTPSPPRRRSVTCWCRTPCATWSPAPASSSPNAVRW